MLPINSYFKAHYKLRRSSAGDKYIGNKQDAITFVAPVNLLEKCR